MSRGNDLQGFFRGLGFITKSVLERQGHETNRLWQNSNLKEVVHGYGKQVETNLGSTSQGAEQVQEKLKQTFSEMTDVAQNVKTQVENNLGVLGSTSQGAEQVQEKLKQTFSELTDVAQNVKTQASTLVSSLNPNKEAFEPLTTSDFAGLGSNNITLDSAPKPTTTTLPIEDSSNPLKESKDAGISGAKDINFDIEKPKPISKVASESVSKIAAAAASTVKVTATSSAKLAKTAIETATETAASSAKLAATAAVTAREAFEASKPKINAVREMAKEKLPNLGDIPLKPRKYQLNPEQKLSARARERKVPSSRVSRLMSYGGLGVGLGAGAIAEVARRAVGLTTKGKGSGIMDSSPFLTEANANRIVDTLCKVRGAALKLGQMLSIQDNSFMNPQLQSIFERVRQSADYMPTWQLEKALNSELGPDWRDKLEEFDDKPFAAASIGQVHRGFLKDGTKVAMKIQYPGVGESIDSDINNLMTLMNRTNLLPEGLYVDEVIKSARRELAMEVDYVNEARCAKKFKELLKDDPFIIVPTVVDELSSRGVITSEFIEGIPVDQCFDMDQETRNKISRAVLELCLKELFIWNFMQTDPNWSNFMYNPETEKLILLDFGASREFDKSFVDGYMRIIRGAADNDRQEVLLRSRDLGFLTGYETKIMEEAHVDAVMILGRAFAGTDYDFGNQNTTTEIQEILPVMLKHRLTAPPEETYSLHRKMSGSFLLCTKLGGVVNVREIFEEIWEEFTFKERNNTANL